MVGPRGCGKSQRLRRLVIARAVAFPASFNVYVNLRNENTRCLRDLVWREFGAWRFPDEDAAPMPEDLTMLGLACLIHDMTGLPMLLAVDEVHSLFTRDTPGLAADFIVDLLQLGESELNHCVTFLCGSAAATCDLCFGKYYGDRAVFPAFALGKSLNHTKFKPIRVPPPDAVVIRFIVKQHIHADADAEADARVCDVSAAVRKAIMTATDCRSIARIASDGASAAVAEQCESVLDRKLHTTMMNALFEEVEEGDPRARALDEYILHCMAEGEPAWFPRHRLLDAGYTPSQLYAFADWQTPP